MTVRRGSRAAGILVAPALALAVALALTLSACSTPTQPDAASTTASDPPGPTASSSAPGASADASPTPTPSATDNPGSCPRAFSRAALRSCVQRAVSVYVAAWTSELQSRGVTAISAPKVRIFDAPPSNPCIDLGETDAVQASFYCGKNGTIYVSATAARYWTTQYAKAAKKRGLLAADAAAAGSTTAALLGGYPLVGTTTELAHELGHWVQDEAGQRSWFESRAASSDFTVSNRATVVAELEADCMAGWVQGRTATEGTWVDTGVGRWAHHATMAELGGDLDAMAAGFTFPPEKATDIIGYGNAYSRLALYDVGDAAGRAGEPGLSSCTSAVVGRVGGTAPPSP